jgi:regulator of nucleoside diphosphate kinase
LKRRIEMLNDTIQVTSFDMRRLFAMTEQMRQLHLADISVLDQLEDELGRSVEVAPAQVAGDVVTMNSTLTLKDLTSEKSITCTLVFPQDADASRHQVSVLAPLGMAVLGYRVGDKISWQMPHGERQLQIEAIHYQPEAAGDFHL